MKKIGYFLFGFLTGVVVLASSALIAGKILYDQYEPTVAEQGEILLEEFTGAELSAKTKMDLSVDLKYVSFEKDSSSNDLYVYGYVTEDASATEETFLLTSTVSDGDYQTLSDNVSSDGVIENDLKDNYGLKGILYIADVLGHESTVNKTLQIGMLTINL
jgi:hypothetical protein